MVQDDSFFTYLNIFFLKEVESEREEGGDLANSKMAKILPLRNF